MSNSPELITSAEAARLLGYNRATINRKAACGEIPVAHESPGRTGQRLFNRQVIEMLARQRRAELSRLIPEEVA